MRARRCSRSRSVLVGEELVVEVRVEVDLGGVTVLGLVDGKLWGSRGLARRRPHTNLTKKRRTRATVTNARCQTPGVHVG